MNKYILNAVLLFNFAHMINYPQTVASTNTELLCSVYGEEMKDKFLSDISKVDAPARLKLTYARCMYDFMSGLCLAVSGNLLVIDTEDYSKGLTLCHDIVKKGN